MQGHRLTTDLACKMGDLLAIFLFFWLDRTAQVWYKEDVIFSGGG
jgi:hypothetical protein